MAKTNTKKPTGLSITRNGDSFVVSWKTADADYNAGTEVCYQLSNYAKNKYTYVYPDLPSETSLSITVNQANYYPTTKTTLTWIKVWVRGKRASYTEGSGDDQTTYYPQWSAWTGKTYSLAVPNAPSMSTSGDYSTAWNETTFTWEVTVDDSSARWFYNTEVQGMLVKDCNETDGSKLTWKSSALGWTSYTSSRNSSNTKVEDTVLLSSGSYTRWFRVRSRGPAGNSSWRYAKHVYATPNRPIIKSVTYKDTASSGLRIFPTWAVSQTASRPIDSTLVQYAIVTPGADFACTASDNDWTDADISRDTGGNDSASILIPNKPTLDQALYVRVTARHDTRETNSAPYMVYFGGIPAPTNLQITGVVEATHRISLTVTNASNMPDTVVAIEYRPASMQSYAQYIVGILEHGETSITVQCPDWSNETDYAIGAFAVIPNWYEQVITADGARYYMWNIMKDGKPMESAEIWSTGSVPKAPANVAVAQSDVAETAQMSWELSWTEADATELSWADHADAWESTDEPSVYVVPNLYTGSWNISGLQTGKTWYFRARYIKYSDDGKETYGPYSNIVSLDLSSAPTTPVLMLSDRVITEDGSVTATWAYTSTDGTNQAFAKICEATITEVVSAGSDGYSHSTYTITYGDEIAHTETAQHITINAADVGWVAGNTYNLCLQVISASGRPSESWSTPVAITVAEPLTATITTTNLAEVTIEAEDEVADYTTMALQNMPLTLTVTGAGAGGTTIVSIERADSYHIDRPDDDVFDGYEGETVALYEQTGEGAISISYDSLLGELDDGAKYRIVATVKDGLGQSAEATQDFEVHWTHQAVMPTATVSINSTDYVAMITPTQPTGYASGDTCDIYRLSADKPELIYRGAEFGTVYVDPYPALGSFGGHRIVYRTANGDYTTATNKLAWLDLRESAGDILNVESMVIDFNGYRAELPYNISLSNSWSKDFQETKYLGGAVRGDWNAYVSRSSSVSTDLLLDVDSDMVLIMRRLAVYSGICHVRTPDGSSFAANVDVTEKRHDQVPARLVNFSLDITRVDPEGTDGVTYDEYVGE